MYRKFLQSDTYQVGLQTHAWKVEIFSPLVPLIFAVEAVLVSWSLVALEDRILLDLLAPETQEGLAQKSEPSSMMITTPLAQKVMIASGSCSPLHPPGGEFSFFISDKKPQENK